MTSHRKDSPSKKKSRRERPVLSSVVAVDIKPRTKPSLATRGQWVVRDHSGRFSKAQKPSASEPPTQSPLFPLTLFFDNEAARDALYHRLTDEAPEAAEQRRWNTIDATLRFLEGKPEIYTQESLAHHVIRNAQLRAEFARDPGLLSSEDVADLHASEAKNRAACANRLKAKGLVFAVDFRGEQWYPAFQFDPETGHPKPIMKEILAHAKGRLEGWSLAFWFVTPNSFLDERTPMSLMDDHPEAVIAALDHELSEFPG